MSTDTPTVLLTFDARSKGLSEALDRKRNQRIMRRLGMNTTVYFIACDYDPARLTDRAKALLASGWRGTASTGDDLIDTPLWRVRRSAPLLSSAETLIQHYGLTGAAAERVRERARGVARCYGDPPGGKVEKWEWSTGAAPVSAVDDATDYLNRLADVPGLVGCGDEPEYVGAAPWAWMLCQRQPNCFIPDAPEPVAAA